MQQVIDSMEVKMWIKTLEQKRAEVGLVRDGIRDARQEMERLEENCEEAYYSIEEAIDSLSELC